MSRRWLLLLPILIAGCSSGIGRPVKEVTAHADASGLQHVRVVAHSFYFEPNRVVLKAGQPVELTLKNGGWFVPHNLTCNAADAGIQVAADVGFFGGSRRVKFTPTKAGEYEFFCHEDAHSKKGMKGTFVVVP